MKEFLEAHKHWEPPPRADRGDSDSDLLYMRIGRALTSYEIVEEEFARLFADLVHSNSEAAFRAYGCIMSPTTKREMLENAAEIYFFHSVGHSISYDDELKTFRGLMSHYQQAAARRNEIAHGTVIAFMLSGPTSRDFHHFLVPTMYSARRTYAATTYQYIHTDDMTCYRRAKYQYVAANVEHFQTRFRQLHSWVVEYRDYLDKQYSKYFPRR